MDGRQFLTGSPATAGRALLPRDTLTEIPAFAQQKSTLRWRGITRIITIAALIVFPARFVIST